MNPSSRRNVAIFFTSVLFLIPALHVLLKRSAPGRANAVTPQSVLVPVATPMPLPAAPAYPPGYVPVFAPEQERDLARLAILHAVAESELDGGKLEARMHEGPLESRMAHYGHSQKDGSWSDDQEFAKVNTFLTYLGVVESAKRRITASLVTLMHERERIAKLSEPPLTEGSGQDSDSSAAALSALNDLRIVEDALQRCPVPDAFISAHKEYLGAMAALIRGVDLLAAGESGNPDLEQANQQFARANSLFDQIRGQMTKYIAASAALSS